MDIIINDNICFMCGKGDGKLTKHHSIPLMFQPKKNVQIPICEDCHKKINLQDMSAMTGFGYHILKELDSIKKKAGMFFSGFQKLKED